MYATTPGWPADPDLVAAGSSGRTVLVPDTDVDGLSAALLVVRTLERLGRPTPWVVLPGRGEHVHRTSDPNGGWLPGRVNFAMRTARDVDLLDLLAGYPLPAGEEVGHGHPKATGGSLRIDDFLDLLAAMGFPPDTVRERLEAAAAA